MDEVTPEQSSSNSDSANVLVSVIMTILGEVLPIVQHKLIAYLDDIQWMDSGSFDTTFEIINRCSNVFIVMTSRPKELLIDRLSSSAIRNLVIAEMRKHRFEIEDVSTPFLKDIVSKSQGNPMVIKLICKYLASSPAVVVDGKILTHIYGTETENISLPLDASAAVIATLDKLPSTTQMVLRVASVAGQFFSLAELSFCLERLQSPSTHSEILEILGVAQQNGVLKSFKNNNSMDADFSFHHYLIYMGIYSSILQSRKEEIHRQYADYYEKIYESSTTRTFLPALLHHLLKLPGQEQRKIKYLREAFEVYADWSRKIEALMYYELLKDLEDTFDIEKKTDFQLAREQRFLAFVRNDSTNPKIALSHYYRAFALLGCDMKKSKFKLLLMLLKCTMRIERMLRSKSEDRYIMALKALSKFCKNVFSGLDVDAYIRIASKSQTIATDAIPNHSKIFEVVDEIRTLTICSFGLVAEIEPGLELAMIEFLYYFSLVSRKDISRNNLSTANNAIGAIFIIFGKLKLARQLYYEAKDLVCDLDQVEISRQGGTVYWCCGALLWALGEFENCIYPYEMFINIQQKAYGATPIVTHFIKIQSLMAHAL
ncbi:hypothetical protein HDU97_009413 [Phlyctochytrium planicorne]|nr:hypothetical protein HDU97_009413 [Phlyctochytrium planicorne]